MIDYIPGTLHWLKRRAELLRNHLKTHLERLHSSRTLDVIEIRLEVQIDKVEKTIREISQYLDDPGLTKPAYVDQNLIRLRKWVKVVDDIESVYLPWVESLGPDTEAMQEFVNRICREANFSTTTVRPVVALYSSTYFYVEEHLHIIYLPRLERHFLLHLPDLYHELGHVLLYYESKKLWEGFEDRIRYYFDQEYKRGRLEDNPLASDGTYSNLADSWVHRWLTEFTCDLIATYLCGPAYGWTHLHLCAAKGSSPNYYPNIGDDHTHPANEARWWLIAAALDDLGWSVERKQIEKRWRSLISALGENEPTNFHVAYPQSLLTELKQQAKESLLSLNVALYSKSSDEQGISRLLNQAWDIFWRSPIDYPEWEAERIARIL